VRDWAILLHLLTTIVRLAGPGGVRSVVAESVLIKHQLRILNRGGNVPPIPVFLIDWSPACVRC
jgi:hypothetical protein